MADPFPIAPPDSLNGAKGLTWVARRAPASAYRVCRFLQAKATRRAGLFHSPIEIDTSSTRLLGVAQVVAVRRRRARLAREGAQVDDQIPQDGHHLHPRPLRTRLASFSTVWPRETPSTTRVEAGIQGPKSWAATCLEMSRNAEFKQPETRRAMTGSVGIALSWVSKA
jgi:hypothetical protein